MNKLEKISAASAYIADRIKKINESEAMTPEVKARSLKEIEEIELPVVRIGSEIVVATGKIGVMYLNLCRHIREKQLAPKVVTALLLEAGMHKVRISEINRVANAADDVWNEFEASTIGFKKVLEITRGTVVDIVAENMGVEKNEAVEGLQQVEGCGTGGNGETSTSGDDVETKTRALEAAMVKCLGLACKLQIRSKKVNIHNGYYIQICKDKNFKKKFATPEADAAADIDAEETASQN